MRGTHCGLLAIPMRSPDCFATSSGTLTAISRLSLGAMLGLVPSCASDGAVDDPATREDIAAEAENGGDVASESVCTTGTYRCYASIRTRAGQRITSHATPFGFGPAELQSAYDIDPDVIVGKPTVAIVIAFGYTAIESDLGVYRAQFGLPPCTIANGCLKVVNQQGQSTPLPANPPSGDNWTVETALDIDMVSAACPLCNILVVQATDNIGDGLFIGQNAAAQLGATVISNSWGGPEEPGTPPAVIAATEAYLDHPNIAIFVSAGDDGYNDGGAGPDYPATSAHTISVGGTRLFRDASARGWSETAWTKGGSACSLSIPKPAYQTASPCAFKATSDIAAVGDPASGVAAYNASVGGWIVVGGTSASSPLVAAIMAATGNGAQSSGAFLAANTSKLNDVAFGNNGSCGTMTLLCNATAGWDGPTGYGTPNAAALLPPGYGKSEEEGAEVDGGCSTGAGAGGGMLVGVALALRRRRR